MLQTISLTTLQFAINKALSLDFSSKEKIIQLEGKYIELVISPLNVHFYIGFSQGEILLLKNIDQNPDTVIHTSPLGLIRLSFLPASKMRSLFNDNIKISGDILIGQQIKELFDNINVDWEGHLAHFTGDVAAFHIGKVVKKGMQFKKKCLQQLQDNSKEFLLYELKLIANQNELEDFYQSVDETRLRVERLNAHINYLMAKNEKN